MIIEFFGFLWIISFDLFSFFHLYVDEWISPALCSSLPPSRVDNDFVYRVIRRPGEILHRIGARHSLDLIATPRCFQTTLRNNNHRAFSHTGARTCTYNARGLSAHTRGRLHANARTDRFRIPASPDGIHRQIELTHVFPLHHVNACTLDVIFFLQSRIRSTKRKGFSFWCQ